jgi:hypothetical protein
VSGAQISRPSVVFGYLQVAEFGRFVTVSTFVRVLGLIYFIAFCSFGIQALGLVGAHGILPVANYLRAVRQSGAQWQVPTVLWISSSDNAIRLVWVAGALSALVVVLYGATRWLGSATGRTVVVRGALFVCLILWLSISTAGQDFLSFQWDILLLEAGFLALFADSSRIRIWLFRWLLFRLMFFSGVVKLLSGDPTWRDLTAMRYHYETQPLPTPLAWYMHQLPLGAQKVSTAFTFVAELLVPLLFFAPRRVRRVAAWITIALQVLILTTGNYTFFNWLTIALCMWLFIEPAPTSSNRYVSAGLATFIGIVSGLLFVELFGVPMPPGGGAILHAVSPFRVVNSYGLFAVMTTERPEILVEGSTDGVTWAAYEFRYKVGDVHRAPPVVAPHQPRLDWQMWFAALGTYQSNRWFVNFMVRLLQGEPVVLRLLKYNPFPNAPPKYIRARLYQYHFTRWGSRDWWTREERGTYFPAVSLK